MDHWGDFVKFLYFLNYVFKIVPFSTSCACSGTTPSPVKGTVHTVCDDKTSSAKNAWFTYEETIQMSMLGHICKGRLTHTHVF